MTGEESGDTCPMCKRPTVRAFRPFCSRRCADIDLSRWLKGSYAIPGQPVGANHTGDEAENDAEGSSGNDN